MFSASSHVYSLKLKYGLGMGTVPEKNLKNLLIAGFYMTLPRGSVQRGGDRAWLVSPTMKGSEDAMCLAFWCVEAKLSFVSDIL